jgi:hypothetical protein
MRTIAFTFVEEYGKQFGNLASLTPMQIEQLHACLPLYYGEEEAAQIDKSNIANLFDEETERWAFASLYHIIDADSKEVLYDFWEYNVDSGTVFIHQSTEHTGIFMMKFGFGFAEMNQHAKLLPPDYPEMLQKAFYEVDR